MLIKYVLNQKLEDGSSLFGGVSYHGETVADFINDEDVSLNENDDISKLNEILVECGIKEIDETNVNIYQSTEEFFKLTVDELLVINDSGYTKEENLLFDQGLKVTFFDNPIEFLEELDDLQNWLSEQDMAIEIALRTINERIAVIIK